MLDARVIGLAAALLLPGGALMASDCAKLTERARIEACVGGDFKRADATLNTVYKQLMAKLGKSGQASLRDVERAWISFRDKHCAFVGSAAQGGSIQATIIGQCQTDLTVDRVAQMAQQLHCGEGDLSCVR